MKELSLYILDIFYNALASEASLIRIIVESDEKKDILRLKITDNGIGMDRSFLKTVKDPYTTTRMTRNVGMGIPLLTQAAEQTGGNVTVLSKRNCGTMLKADFVLSNIDTPPMGNLLESLISMIVSLNQCDLIFVLKNNGEIVFDLDTAQLREVLGSEISLSQPDVIAWIREYFISEFENNTGE